MPESIIERRLLDASIYNEIYRPTEKIRTFVVENFPDLGKYAALRFIEWVQNNAGWTIALPTGKTPEYFIKWVTHLLSNWDAGKVRKILEENGLDPGRKPDMKSLSFIQIDEFYPIDSRQHNSFFYYVNKFYIQGFGLDPKKALLIDPNTIGLSKGESLSEIWPNHVVDLSLRTRSVHSMFEEKQRRVLAAVDQFCTDYEDRIRDLGGIGFFLGGIGPDGHIGFNVRGSDHFSTTRLTETNYETQAAAATDLGGIETSRNRLVITIGLQTIVYSPDATAIIIAAGEAKAEIVRQAIESDKNNQVAASILQELDSSAFFITKGAAKLLNERRHCRLEKAGEISDMDTAVLLTEVAFRKNKRLVDLKPSDFREERSGPLLLNQLGSKLSKILRRTEGRFKQNIMDGLQIPTEEIFLHTAPHHDDIMLGYLPFLVRAMREQSNEHYFNYLTSGFTAVANAFMEKRITDTMAFLSQPEFKTLVESQYFEPHNIVYENRDVYQYLDGLAANDEQEKKEGAARRFMRNLNEIHQIKAIAGFKQKLDELLAGFRSKYPGEKDTPDVQKLKGMVREWEADVLWGYFGFSAESIMHSRLGFYTGDIFTEEPEVERDVMPVVETLRKINPTIVTVAFDPEGSGPDTHYKVLQAISSALKIYQEESGRTDISVWGYRNVWYRYNPAEANRFIPVTFNTMAIMHDAFIHSFVSQAQASFPSYEFDGPFSGLAKQIQVQQYQQMKTVLGRDFFYLNPDSRIRSTRGFVFLKTMSLDEFYQASRELRKTTEAQS